MSSRLYAAIVGVWLLAAVAAVAWTATRAGTQGEEEAEALPASVPGLRSSFETEDTLPSALAGVAIEPVQDGWTGPGGRPFFVTVRSAPGADYRHRQIGLESFALALRLDEAGRSSEPCASCHTREGLVDDASRPEDVHRNVQPVHPEQTGAACLTCHAAAEVGRLGLERGGTVALDHAYQLCAQCHYSQVESWAFGAHGKRLVGWRGRRVVMGCADCHNPHSPATELRLPMGGVQLPGALRAEPEGDGHD